MWAGKLGSPAFLGLPRMEGNRGQRNSEEDFRISSVLASKVLKELKVLYLHAKTARRVDSRQFGLSY